MFIGFDAKRAFFNRSGLGNYSRDTITLLATHFSQNNYLLYTPKPQKSIPFYTNNNIEVKGPEGFCNKLLPSFWRSSGIKKQLIKDKINLYHGLSNELPKGIEKTGIPSIVTIHDLIFMRYPEFYKPVDRKIYMLKFSDAAKNATRVIAISQQTKNDIVEFLGTNENKIDVVYQSCNPIFWNPSSEPFKNDLLQKYNLPKNFMLYVGTIEDRKNLLNIVKAIHTGKIDYPLVVIGKPTPYINKVHEYIQKYDLKNIHFLHKIPTNELPAFYQMATLFVYPSLFEGFGIPILEAITSKTPVITSKGSCFSEAGGKSSVYVDPYNIEELTKAIKTVLSDSALRDSMIIDGYLHAQLFKGERVASNLMDVYNKILL
jgi:glycosyltransferase involved in cell wall biosynthesis